MGAGGEIGITLSLSGGRVGAVDIASTRRDVSRALFAGRAPGEVLEDVGRVFSLCGVAQSVAAARAFEAAGGAVASVRAEAARDLMRRAEMAGQLAMRLGLHWPDALSLELSPGMVRDCLALEAALRPALRGALVGGRFALGERERTKITPVIEALRAKVAAALTPGGLRAALREALEDRGWNGFGALPDGAAPEPGPLARGWDLAEVVAARAAHGAGLCARLEAAFCELAALVGELEAGLTDGIARGTADPNAVEAGEGSARVETARGLLIHHVTVKHGKVTDYAIDAPTEAKFAPGGPVAAGLVGAGAEGLETAARLHVLAIDPCVDFTLEVDHA